MSIPDTIEIGEARAERWADSHIDGDRFLCDGCDEWYPVDFGVTASPDPYAPLICTHCADPAPYCSYGHKTKADCNCEPIADNE